MAISRIHVFVSGQVQGVFFRGSLARQARRLGLAGFVRNLSDGRVEYVAIGDETAVGALKDWSRVGPVTASVTGIQVSEYAGDRVFSDFEIEYMDQF